MNLTNLLRELVSIPGINPMGRTLGGSLSSDLVYEHRVTAYLEEQFRSLGVRWQRQSVAPLRDNIVAWYEPPTATQTIIFEVHQDTVPIDHMTIDPFAGRVENGKLYGRGACDVRGSMASMLAAFTRLVREKPAKSARVLLACTVDEEHTFLGVQRLAQEDLRGSGPSRQGPIWAIVAEPTNLNIVHTHKGAVRWHVDTTGRSCHSSRPELGINAIYHMGILLGLIDRHAQELRSTKTHPLLGPATMSVGRIEGGTSVNTVPDRCRIEIDRRVLPGEDSRLVPNELRDFLAQHAPPEIRYHLSEPWLNCPALPNEGNEELVARLGVTINSVVGKHRVDAVPYGTDASTLAEVGIPSVVFGPGDIAQAHTCDEWIDLAEVDQAAEILYRFATRE